MQRAGLVDNAKTGTNPIARYLETTLGLHQSVAEHDKLAALWPGVETDIPKTGA